MPRVQAFSHPNVRWPRNGRICKNRELQVQKVLASREESAVEGKSGQDERKNKPIYILFERFFRKYKSRCQYPRFLILEKKQLSNKISELDKNTKMKEEQFVNPNLVDVDRKYKKMYEERLKNKLGLEENGVKK